MIRTLLSVILLFTVVWSPAQERVLDTLRNRFEQYRVEHLTEKIYAHLDRNFYLTGETLWFKVYAVDGTLHQPLDMSVVAYVELLDNVGNAVLQAKIQLEDSRGHGSLFLPASLSSGNYTFRAYTSWMKNFPPEYFYTQVISIANPFLTPDRAPTKTVALRAEFFPEGGHLVAGVRSKIAFRIADHNGKGTDCGGVVETAEGDLVTTFKSSRSGFGLGSFSFTPQVGVNYRAVLTGTNGNRVVQQLPQVYPAGYTLSVRDSSNTLFIEIETRGVPDDHVYLFVHARQMISHSLAGQIVHSKATFRIDKNELAKGISHLTLFNAQLQPVCERLYFSAPPPQLDIKIETSQKVVSPRTKISISLQTNSNGSPAVTNASLAVYRKDSLTSNTGAHIHPHLWLTSDLASAIESPGFFFGNPDDESVDRLADLLMMTQGWRRFDWDDILNGRSTPAFLPEIREHIVTAIVSSDDDNNRSHFVYLGSPGKIVRAYGSWTNRDGEARFEIKDFYGPRRIIVQAAVDSMHSYKIEIADPFSSKRDGRRVAELIISDAMEEDLTARSIAMQVQDIYYYEEFGTLTELPQVDSSAFYGKADNTYMLDDYTRFPVMEEVMREYVPGVFVRKRRDGFHFVVVDYSQGGILPGDPMVLLDGVPVPDVDNIMRVDPLRVRKLEVIKRPYHLGQAVFSGIVSYTTYNGDLGGLELDPQSISLDYEGLQLKRIFHKPAYKRDETENHMPDQRFLLHWEPDIRTGPDGRYELDFYTSDVPGEYVVVIEGITDAGHSGTGTYTFTVKE